MPLHAYSLFCRNAGLCGSTGAPAKTDVPVSRLHHPADSVDSATAGDLLAQMVSHTNHENGNSKLLHLHHLLICWCRHTLVISIDRKIYTQSPALEARH